MRNRGAFDLYLSDIVLRFDFGIYTFHTTVYKPIPPRRTTYLGVWSFTLPQLVGSHRCFIDYVVHEYTSNGWEPHPRHKENPVILKVFPKPSFY